MKTLNKIAKESHTEKARHAPAKHFCREVYPIYFEPIRHLPLKVLEIGIRFGGSLRMWREYFPNAQIYGIDCKEKFRINEDRITSFIGGQEDTEFLQKVVDETGPLDIVIDDGGHRSSDQIASLDFLFPHLNSGGLYVIEDMHLSYKERWCGTGGLRREGTIAEYLKHLSDYALVGNNEGVMKTPSKHIRAIHLYDNIAILEKEYEEEE